MNDKTLDACQCHEKHAPAYWKGVFRDYKDALEKAEEERDEARASAARLLTPDAITDEMVERARAAYQNAPVSQSLNDDIRDMLIAALTEPPARPEGAEELARLIADADVGEWDCGDLADALLTTGRVRIIAEEDPR